MQTRRAFLGGSLALPALTVAARAQRDAGILRYGLSAYPPNLLPWENTGSASGTVKLLTHRSLVTYDHLGQLRGEIAQSWSLDGDGAWAFKLRSDAVFHNGEPVTADDVKWSIEQIAGEKSTAYMRAQMQSIARVEIADPLTVRLVTKAPNVTLPTWFAQYNSFVIWRKSQPGEPIGAGPFRITAQERGVSIDLAPFDRFYKPGFPKLRGVHFVAYPDESLRMTALLAGDVDMIEYVPYETMAAIEANPRLKLDTVVGPFMCMLFNGSKPPFSIPAVRQAIAYGINREEIVRAVFVGRGKPLGGVPIPEGTPFYDDELARRWTYDPARAKQLLAEAGFPDGFQANMLATSTYAMHKGTAEIAQQHLAKIGIQCTLNLPDWGSRVTLGSRGQYDLAVHGLLADSNDPDGLSVLMDMSLPPSYVRSIGVQAPRTAAAFARGRAEFDQAKRIAIYREMQLAALEETPLVGLTWRAQGYAMDRSVQGFTNLPGELTTSSGGMIEETYFG
jgi:peptide/nickel transport system substrate-binding protein